MRRLFPYLVFLLVTAALVAFIYKDRLFPPVEGDAVQAGGRGQGGGGSGGGGRGRGRGGPGGGQPVPVLTEKANTDNVPVYLSGVGTVQAFNTATIRAQVSGRLIEVAFGEGQEVKRGDILARIDPVLYKAAFDQATAKKGQDEAILANGKLDEKRYAGLAKSDYSSQQQADTARSQAAQYEAQVKQDQAAIDTARANLDYCTIRAPLDGRTGLRLVDAGNLVSSADATGIAVITQLRPIAVVFTLPENTVSDVLEAQGKAKLELQASAGGTVLGSGVLEVIDNQIDQATGTVKLKGTFANDGNKLWPGQFVNIKLKLKTLENAVVVPSVAIQQGAAGSYVYIVSPDETVKLANVTVTQEGERVAVIATGVSTGDGVVTSGFASLTDGAKVRIDNPVPAGSAGPAPADPPAGGSQSSGKRRKRDGEASANRDAKSSAAR